MHDIGLNSSQLEQGVRHIDETIALARSWAHDLYHATDAFDMDETAGKLGQAMAALDEARAALKGYEDAIERDHNSMGTVRLV